MITIDLEKAKEQFQELASSCSKYNEIVKICTNEGNVMLISEREYNNLIESFLLASSGVYQSIEDAINTPLTDLTKEEPWKNN